MRHIKYLLTFVAVLAVSSLAVADNRHGNYGHQGGKHNNNYYGKHNNNYYGKHNGNYYGKHNGNYYGKHSGNYYGKHKGNYYSHNGRNYKYDSYRHHDNKHRGYNPYYGYRNHHRNYYNYRPYYESRYHYRPVRGLGYYFTRDGYGYGHWHDGVWCATVHPQSYYYDYYSNYPYNDGWQFGDGDFGINFYFNY